MTEVRAQAARLGRRIWDRSGAEWKLLLASAVVLLGTWGLVSLTEEVLEGDTQSFDAVALEALRSSDDPAMPIGPAWLLVVMRDLTALGDMLIIGLLVGLVALYLMLERKPRAAGLVVVAVGSGQLVVSTMKMAISRDRPDLVPHLVDVSTASFPSGHSSMAAVAYLTLGAMLARVAKQRHTKLFVICVAMLMTLAIGVSRIYLGVHYPSDVAGGWLVGSLWAALWWCIMHLVWRREARRSHPAPPGNGADDDARSQDDRTQAAGRSSDSSAVAADRSGAGEG